MTDAEKYTWQVEAIENWKHNGCCGIVEAVTGAGKTHLALNAVKYLLDLYPYLTVAVVVPTKAIMNQWYAAMTKMLGHERVCCYKSGQTGLALKNITIYVINSARFNLARRLLGVLKSGREAFLIADECHHYASHENRRIFEFKTYPRTLPGKFFSLGLSATLKPKDLKEVLVPNLGAVVYRYTLDKAIHDEIVSEFVVMQIAVRFMDDEWDEYVQMTDNLQLTGRKLLKACPMLRNAGSNYFPILQELAKGEQESSSLARHYLAMAYKRKRLVCNAENRSKCAEYLLEKISYNKRCILFSESIEQADTLYRMISEKYEGKVGRYHSGIGEQACRNTLRNLRDGQIRILITCKALDEGLDVPEMDAAIIVSGTSVQRQRIQRLGRVLRASSDKKQAVLYYIYIRESSEEKSYFPYGGEKFKHAELEFEADSIVYPLYDRYADEYFQELREKGADKEVLEEALRCALKGRYSGDWLLGQERCFRYAEESKAADMRNYWYCMGKIAGFDGVMNHNSIDY